LKIRIKTRMDNDVFGLVLASQIIIAVPFISISVFAGVIMLLGILLLTYYLYSSFIFNIETIKRLLMQVFGAMGIVSGNLVISLYVTNKILLALSLLAFNLIETTIVIISILSYLLILEKNFEN